MDIHPKIQQMNNNNIPDETYIKLFRNGLDVNTIINKKNETVLDEACSQRRLELVKYLIENGADVNTKDDECKNLLHYAIDVSNKIENDHSVKTKEIIQEILKKDIKINETDQSNRTPLHLACKYGDPEIVQMLVKKGADINANGGPVQGSPLFVAILNGKNDIAKNLLEQGAKVKGFPYILYAVGFGTSTPNWKTDHELVKLLQSKGADINRTDGTVDCTPLQCAVQMEDLETVKLLFELRADPTKKGWSGK